MIKSFLQHIAEDLMPNQMQASVATHSTGETAVHNIPPQTVQFHNSPEDVKKRQVEKNRSKSALKQRTKDGSKDKSGDNSGNIVKAMGVAKTE